MVKLFHVWPSTVLCEPSVSSWEPKFPSPTEFSEESCCMNYHYRYGYVMLGSWSIVTSTYQPKQPQTNLCKTVMFVSYVFLSWDSLLLDWPQRMSMHAKCVQDIKNIACYFHPVFPKKLNQIWNTEWGQSDPKDKRVKRTTITLLDSRWTVKVTAAEPVIVFFFISSSLTNPQKIHKNSKQPTTSLSYWTSVCSYHHTDVIYMRFFIPVCHYRNRWVHDLWLKHFFHHHQKAWIRPETACFRFIVEYTCTCFTSHHALQIFLSSSIYRFKMD